MDFQVRMNMNEGKSDRRKANEYGSQKQLHWAVLKDAKTRTLSPSVPPGSSLKPLVIMGIRGCTYETQEAGVFLRSRQNGGHAHGTSLSVIRARPASEGPLNHRRMFLPCLRRCQEYWLLRLDQAQPNGRMGTC